jgi:hypothetical protein
MSGKPKKEESISSPHPSLLAKMQVVPTCIKIKHPIDNPAVKIL